MNNLSLACIFFISMFFSTLAGAQLNDLHHYKKAVEQASLEGKPLILLFTASWCPPCKKLKRKLLTDPDFYEVVNAKFVFASINVDRNRSIADKYAISGIPDMVFVVNGEIKDRIKGFARKGSYMSTLDRLITSKKRRIKRKGDSAKVLELNDAKIAVDHWTQLVNNGFHEDAMDLAEAYIKKQNDSLDLISYEWLMFYCEQPDFSQRHQFKKRCHEVYDTINPISIVNFFNQSHQLQWRLKNYSSKEILSTFGGLFGKEIGFNLYTIYASLFMPYQDVPKNQKAIIHNSLLEFLDMDIVYQDWEPMVKLRLVNFILENQDGNFKSGIEKKLGMKLEQSDSFLSGYDVLAVLELQKGNKKKSIELIALGHEKSVAQGKKFESIIPQLRKQGVFGED